MGMAHDAATWAFYLAAIVWWTIDLGYGPLQLVLLGTTLEITMLVSEVPTGVVADRFSRKWSTVISFAIMAAAMFLHVATTEYWVLLISQAMFGLGWTFRSGADVAWLTDEMVSLGATNSDDGSSGATNSGDGNSDDGNVSDPDEDLSPILLRRHRLGMVAGLAALLPTTLLAGGHLRLTIAICAGALALTTVWLAVAMTDHFRAGFDEDEHPQSMREILTEGVATTRRVPTLRILVGVMVLMGIGAEALDRLGFKQFLDEGDFGDDSIFWTGLLFMILGGLGVAVVWITEQALERGVKLVMVAVILLAVSAGGAVIAAIAPAIGIAIGLALQDPCREALDPVSVAWTNREAPPAARATVHSLVNQAHGLGEVAGGVTLGAVAELTGIRWVIFIAGGLWAVAALLARRGIRHDNHELAPAP